MLKCTVFSRKNKWIFFLSKLKFGKVHDYKMLKTDFPPTLNWFDKLIVHIDLGYHWAAGRSVASQGFEDDYSAKTVLIPFKKKKKEKELCDLKKAYNRKLAQWRIYIEPLRRTDAIGGMKRYRVLAERIRIKSINQIDIILEVCAGLWNFRVKFD